MINNFINTCFATTETLRDIAGYSHLIPAVLSLLLGTFIFVKAKYNLFSRVFLSFVIYPTQGLSGALLRETAENAVVETTSETAKIAQKAWQQNASSWWLMNATNMDIAIAR
jgi:hypothetical protein